MSPICLGVGSERQSPVLLGLTRKPMLLFRHPRRVRPEKGKSIDSIVERRIIELLRLRLPEDLPCLVETLQGKQVVAEISVHFSYSRLETERLVCNLSSLLILPLAREHYV